MVDISEIKSPVSIYLLHDTFYEKKTRCVYYFLLQFLLDFHAKDEFDAR